MKLIILFVLHLIIHAAYANPDIAQIDAQIVNDEYTLVDEAILKVQIEADKKQNAYRSAVVSREDMYTITNSVRLSRRPGMSVLYEFLRNKDNIEESVQWSQAIAKNKYAVGAERLELPRAVLEAAHKKNLFRKTEKILDCQNKQVISHGMKTTMLRVSFYPSIRPNKLLEARTSSIEDANKEIDKIFSHISFLASELNLKQVSGILYVSNHTELQFCEVNLDF